MKMKKLFKTRSWRAKRRRAAKRNRVAAKASVPKVAALRTQLPSEIKAK